jgi:adenylate cyclase
MPIEIERKFLVTRDDWRELARPGRRFCQGRIAEGPNGKVRIRRAGDQAFITFKGPRHGIARAEFEYPIPVADAEELLKRFCEKPLVEKTRHEVPCEGRVWEVDVYAGLDLTLAEVELEREDEPVRKPSWVGREVTADPAYGNKALARRRAG